LPAGFRVFHPSASVSKDAVFGILLAAGRGRRFDASGDRNKLLQTLPDGRCIAVASAMALLAACPSTLAVVRDGGGELAARLRAAGCEVLECAGADDGMGVSLASAIAARRDAPAWLVALADMPHVRPATMVALVETIAGGAGIAMPVQDGRRGNPVAFARCHLDRLLASSGDRGARDLLRTAAVSEVPVEDDGIFRDIDTPADLGAA
jgi:molybdenum cofactor cytidylyltransferase